MLSALGASPIPPVNPGCSGGFLRDRSVPMGRGSRRSSHPTLMWSVGEGVLLGTGDTSVDAGGTGDPPSALQRSPVEHGHNYIVVVH